MTCQELSDRMPDVARELASWSATEAEHLASCADCRREWVVVTAGGAVAQHVQLDADALAMRVLDRLRTEPVIRRSARPWWLIGLAAAAAVVALMVVPGRSPTLPTPAPVAPPIAAYVPGLAGLGTAGLSDLLETFDNSWTETSTSDAPSLDDLDLQELEQVQSSLEI